jgi:putative endonuclease
MQPCVYILTNHKHGTLYVGMTTDLQLRIWQHKGKFVPGFTAEHDLNLLVWYELHSTVEAAAHRERAIKRWHRRWKIRLIEEKNPNWKDFYSEL